MKNRIWNQTKAAVLAMAAILSGICVPFQEMQVSGAELVAPVLNIEQSAKWTDEENYKAELTLRLSGLNTLKDVSKVDQEQEKIQAETVLQDGAFRVTFDLKNFKDWKALRFDPLEGKPCICRIDHAGTNAKLKAVNASGKVEHGDLFLTTDPVYLVKMEENKDQVKISGMIAVLSMEEALERANWLLGKKNGLAFWRK